MTTAYYTVARYLQYSRAHVIASSHAWLRFMSFFRISNSAPVQPKVTQKQVLHGVEGAAMPHEFLVLLGPSGSGKTTLIQVRFCLLGCGKGHD